MKLKNLGKVVVVGMLIGLTSCASDSTLNVNSLNIYQPSTLKLEKGTLIQTKEGGYTPQIDEVWHSDSRYRRLEREIYSSNK